MQKSKNIYQFVLDTLLIGILFLIPLLHTAHLYNSFRLLKTTTFITLASIALIFAVLLFIKKNFSFWKNYKWLLIILGGFFIFKIISLIFSINMHISFWGGYSKLEGFLTWAFYFAFVLMLCFNFLNKKKRNIYFLFILLSIFLVNLYSFLQHFGYIGKQWSGDIMSRPIGTLGNPIHLGALMMFSIPISLYGIFNFKSYIAKAFAAISLIGQFCVLIFTQARSSWSAFAIAAIIIGFLLLLKYQKKKYWAVIFLLVVAIFITGFVYIGKTNPTFTKNQYIKRSFSILDISDKSNNQRIYFWQGSWNAFLAKPWLGWGEDNLNIGFDRNYPPKLTDLPETRIDRAHNIFLDVLAEEGICGFIFFMALFGYIFYLSIKLFFHQEKEKSWIGFLGIFFVIGYCLQYFFMYPVISSYVIIFFVFSQVVSSNFINYQQIGEKTTKELPAIQQLMYAAPVAVLFAIILIFGTIPRISANNTFTRALKNPQQQENYMRSAYEKWPSPHFRSRLGSYYVQKTFALTKNNPEMAEIYAQKSQATFLKDIELFPNNYVSYLNLASIYNMFGQFEIADNYFKKAVSLAPTRHDVYWTWAENVSIRDDHEKAIAIFKKAILVDSKVALPYYKLSLYYQRIGIIDEADKYFQLAMLKGLQPWQIKKHGISQQPAPTTPDSNQLSSEDKSSL